MRSAKPSSWATVSVLALAALLLSACAQSTAETTSTAPTASQSAPVEETPEATPSTSPSADADPAPAKGSYIDYATFTGSPATYAETDQVLFFAASWCPTCQAVDKDINANIENLPEGLTIVKVDYDDSDDLKQKYGVTIQHTFVQVDAAGNELAQWSGSPSVAEIKAKVV